MKASLLLITYKHERFVAEAIRSAMAQDYPDLEIVVCDDASPDRTREILERELTACPPHLRVVCSHAATNGGLHANFNRGMAACTGEVIVVMAGDDISLPGRVSAVVREFAAHPECMLVCNDWIRIDATGKPLDAGFGAAAPIVQSYHPGTSRMYTPPLCGAAASYRAVLRDTFGPMRKGHHGEDNCYWVRAQLMGTVRYLPAPLVHWRVHAENQSNWERSGDTPPARARHIRFLRMHQNLSRQWSEDLTRARQLDLIDDVLHRTIGRVIRYEKEWQRLRRYSVTAAPWRLWWRAARRVVATKPTLGLLLKTYRGQLFMRLLPPVRTRYWRHHFRGS